MNYLHYIIKNKSAATIVALFATLSLILLVVTFAAVGTVQIEGESANTTAKKVKDVTASKGSYIQFGKNTSGAQANLDLILNQSTRFKKFLANMPGVEGEGFWKNGYDETVVAEKDLKITDFLGPASEHYFSGQAQGGDNFGFHGLFRTECEFSHFAYDDPIVYPGQPGKAHLHMFFGNTHANAYSTVDSLRNTGSGTCNGGPLNRSSYWMPAVIDQSGDIRTPDRMTIYYKSLGTSPAYDPPRRQTVEPYPYDLKIITGKASSNADQRKTVSGDFAELSFEYCGMNANQVDKGVPYGTKFPKCGSQGLLKVVMRFPFCWDGKNADSSDHVSHMAYPNVGWSGNNCPASHPIMLPSIEYRVDFAYKPGDDTSKWFFASDVRKDNNGGYVMAPGGNGTTMHADWYGAWNPTVTKEWVWNCNNNRGAFEGRDCGSGMLSWDGNTPWGNVGLKRIASTLGQYDDPIYSATEMVKLCPGKTLTADIKSVAICK